MKRFLVVAASVTAVAFVQAGPAFAGEITQFIVANKSAVTVNIQISKTSRCVEPDMAKGFIGGAFSIPPGEAFAKTIARQSGHGCDGKGAHFSARPLVGGKAYAWQSFEISGSGEMFLEGRARGYVARGGQVTAPQPFVWELFMKSRVLPTTPPEPADPSANGGFKTKRIELSPANTSKRVFLVQDGSGGDRSVAVRPIGRSERFDWVLDPAGPAGVYYISNLESGLVLTQSGSGAEHNVEAWGRQSPPNLRQQWKILKLPNGNYRIVNRGTLLGLDFQADGGVAVGAGFKEWDVNEGADLNLAKLTIESVKAIHVSTGQDANTAALFTGIEIAFQVAAGVASGGSSVAGSAAVAAAKAAVKAIAKQGLKAAAKGITKQWIKQQAKKYLKKELRKKIKAILRTQVKGVIVEVTGAPDEAADETPAALEELADLVKLIDELTSLQGIFNKIYGESPDQLYITANGTNIWPDGGYRKGSDTESGETRKVDAEFIFDASKPMRLELWDYDSGSNDDSLGYLTWNADSLPVRYDGLYVGDPLEGSLYEVTYKIESFPTPKITNAMVVGTYTAEPAWFKSDSGTISQSANGGLTWTPDLGKPFGLIPRYNVHTLVTAPNNAFRALGFDRFELIIEYNEVTGFEFLGRPFVKAAKAPTGSDQGCPFRDAKGVVVVERGGTYTDATGDRWKVGQDCSRTKLPASTTCSYLDAGNGNTITVKKGASYTDSRGFTYTVGQNCSQTQTGFSGKATPCTLTDGGDGKAVTVDKGGTYTDSRGYTYEIAKNCKATEIKTPKNPPVENGWKKSAEEHAGRIGFRYGYTCAAGGEGGRSPLVYGTDVYTLFSNICNAAIHAGVITLEQGGTVTIEIRPKETLYPRSTRNGVSTRERGSNSTGSFRFVK